MAISTASSSPLDQRFAALPEIEKAAEWVSFLDAVDAGDMGWHPYYPVLAPMYAAGGSPFDPEPLEAREIDIFSVDGSAYLEAVLEPAAV